MALRRVTRGRETVVDNSQQLVWKLYAGVVAAGTTFAAAKAIEEGWRLATGHEPPEVRNPETPLRQAVVWVIASGVGIGMARLFMHRFAAKQWSKATGTPAPTSL